jgi:hypothetical protein
METGGVKCEKRKTRVRDKEDKRKEIGKEEDCPPHIHTATIN